MCLPVWKLWGFCGCCREHADSWVPACLLAACRMRPQTRIPLPDYSLKILLRSSGSERSCTFFSLRSCPERKICVVHDSTGADFVWYWMPQSASLAAGHPCLGSRKVCTGSVVLLGREHRHWELLAQTGILTHCMANCPEIVSPGSLGATRHRKLTQPVFWGKVCWKYTHHSGSGVTVLAHGCRSGKAWRQNYYFFVRATLKVEKLENLRAHEPFSLSPLPWISVVYMDHQFQG